MTLHAYKVELDINDKQRTALLRHAGAARWAYNFGLRRKIDTYAAGEKSPSAIDLHRELNALKKTTVPWMYEVSKCAPQEALRNLDAAFAGFFRRCKTGKGKPGFPKFKSRKRGIGSFTLTGSIHVEVAEVKLPRLGSMRLFERGYVPVGAKVTKATVSERAGHWFVSLLVDEDRPAAITGSEVLGVDVGIESLAVLSDGTTFQNPKAMRGAQEKVKRLQRAVSRKVKGSFNRKKAVARLARQHYRISNIRKDAINKATTSITKRCAVLGIESLNVAGMMKNHCIAGALSDAGLGEFLRCLKYKMAWRGGRIVEVDRWYPSSQICSSCGARQPMPLNKRQYVCSSCGVVENRDVNAAINLKNMAASSAVTACCPGSAGPS